MKSKKIASILENVIEDFNTKWSSHSDKNFGIKQYAEEISLIFASEIEEKDIEIRELRHSKEALRAHYLHFEKECEAKDKEIFDLKNQIEDLKVMVRGYESHND